MLWQRVNSAKNRVVKYFCVFSIIGVCTLMTRSAGAVPISGTISFIGNATLNNPLGSATAIDFSGVKVLGGMETGTYSSVSGGIDVTFNPFTFSPFSGSSSELWTFTIGGTTTYSFDITSETTHIQNSNFLDIGGAGMAYVTGFDPTPATWTITGGSSSSPATKINIGSIATIAAVPDAPSYWPVALLGLFALLGGLPMACRRWKSAF